MTPAEELELVKEMSATRKAIAYYLERLGVVEEKVDKILNYSNNNSSNDKRKPRPYIEQGYRE